MNHKQPSIGVAVITYKAKKHLPHCLPALLQSPLNPRVLVVNSSSQDGTVETAQEMGAETLVIPRSEFNHGTTREQARQHLQSDILVMTTPDAYAKDHHVLEKLINPLVTGQASVSYARQIPHKGAGFFESFPRKFNYTEKSHIRGIEDIKKYGVYTFFNSDAYAAYSNQALDEIGGFQPVLIGEDTVAAAKLLRKGHKIAYVSEAVVYHSHKYTLIEEFRRNFDTGLARKQYEDLIHGGSDTKRGTQYVVDMTKHLVKHKPHLLPYAYLQTFVKWLGYKLGHSCTKAPRWIKKTLSGQDFYWVTRIKSPRKLGD